jgi:citrate synthase
MRQPVPVRRPGRPAYAPGARVASAAQRDPERMTLRLREDSGDHGKDEGESSMATSGSMAAGTGLEGVSLGPTEIALVDGENGRLIYRGHDAERLAQEVSFEEVAFLLWEGRLPEPDELDELRRGLAEAMQVPDPVRAVLDTLTDALPMDALRSALSVWAALRHREEGGELEDARWALAANAAIVAQHNRGPGSTLETDPARPFVENYLTALNGRRPEPAKVRGLDAYFTLAAEHGMNASTFTGRVIVSTLSDIGSGLVGAIGALKGRLHGGAPSHVSTMIDEIGSFENTDPWLREKLAAGERLMGFGHRVYKTYDPRARALGMVAGQLAGDDPRLALARHVEERAIALLEEYKPGRRLYTNVEYYAAAVLSNVDLPPQLYTPSFAVARTAGWCAHMLEQLRFNRLIRPSVDYVGPQPAE